jgi:hypothetical protein
VQETFLKVKVMQTETPQLAVVVKGYYEKKDNTVFGIYLLDKQNVMMIPCSNDFLTEEESFDCLGDTVIFLKKQGYQVHFDIRKETEFDVTKHYPSVKKVETNNQ